jgi:hypothetical protein
MATSNHHRSGPPRMPGEPLPGDDLDNSGSPMSTREREIQATRKLFAESQEILDKMDKSSTFRTLQKRDYPTFDRKEFCAGPLLGTGGFGIVFEVESFKLNGNLSQCLVSDKQGQEQPPVSIGSSNPQNGGSGRHSAEFVNSDENNNSNGVKSEKIDTDANGDNSLQPRRSIVAFADSVDTSAASRKSRQGEAEDADITASTIEELLEDDNHYDVNGARQYMADNVRRGGDARFAFKRLHRELTDLQKARGMVDLAIEAKFLSVLWHPNISELCECECVLL